MPLSAPLSLQLYSLRKFPPLDRQLGMLERLGYTNVEPYDALYHDPDTLERGLDQHGLEARSGHFSLDLLDREPERVVAIARRLRMSTVVVPFTPVPLRPTDRRGWERFGAGLARHAATLADAGLRLAYHNHDFEFRPLPDGSVPLDHIIVDGVAWEADLAWLTLAGADPAAWLARLSNRVPLVHVKDVAGAGQNAGEDGWSDVGAGTLPWADLWRAAVAAGAEIMIAEHDNPSDGERFARTSAAAMTRFARDAA